MSISGAFLWRFLDDVWDLLPTEDRKLFETYWSAKIQIAANLEQKAIEATLSTEVERVPVFLTERWERFIMDEATVDLLQQVDSLVLSGVVHQAFSRETIFLDTLSVSNTSGQISHTESLTFPNQNPKTLRYGNIVPGSVSVTLGSFKFTNNRDYAVNYAAGTIQPVLTGRIPFDESVTVEYQHQYYTKDLDYVVDESNRTIARKAGTTIPDGGTVSASYGYNATSTLSMTGTSGVATGTSFNDPNADFATLLPNRTLTVTQGPLAGIYSIVAVANPTTLVVSPAFPSEQLGSVRWSINAFPHGMRIDKQIRSIEYLRDLVDDPTMVFVQGRDYRISNGILSCRSAFPFSAIGPDDLRRRQMWAEETLYNKQTPYRNFGVLIDFFRTNSEEYKLALQGLWYTFWTGSTVGNLERGLQILMGLPYARSAGTVINVDVIARIIDIRDADGEVVTYSIPDELESAVAVGDEVSRFDVLTNGVSVIDGVNTPGFVAERLGRAGVERYLTDLASRGLGNTDETKALDLLENHLFIPEILQEAFRSIVNVGEIRQYLDNLKPAWTNYIFTFGVSEDETFLVGEDDVEFPLDFILDLTTTISFNPWNTTLKQGFYIQEIDGEIIAGGTQATGNFRDGGVDFAASGIDEGDYLYILSPQFKGVYRVLTRISSSVLSIDIPDADIIGVSPVHYGIVTEECLLDNDAVNLHRENIILPGTTFSAPATYNTKTDADFASTSISNMELLALLLVNPGAGTEADLVQDITDGDVALGEFTVGSPPGLGAQAHEIASCALERDENAPSPGFTAYAI